MAIIAESKSALKLGSRPPVESNPTRQDAGKLVESAGQPGADCEDRQDTELLPGKGKPPAESSPIARQEDRQDASKSGKQPPPAEPSTIARQEDRQDARRLADTAGQPGVDSEDHDLADAARRVPGGMCKARRALFKPRHDVGAGVLQTGFTSRQEKGTER